MGYTLVAKCGDGFFLQLESLLNQLGIKSNKIPFGRDCDREAADKLLPYHMTVFHWGKAYDSLYLERINKLHFVPFRIEITGVQVMPAEEGSSLLFFEVKPGDGFLRFNEELVKVLGVPLSDFLHITLAVSKNRDEIEFQRKQLNDALRFPFQVDINELDLFHIWKPVYLAQAFYADR